MARKRPPRFPKDHGTSFDNWRKAMNYTHAEAAEALGFSMFHICQMSRGKLYATKKPEKFIPTKTTRLLMAAIAQGYKPERAWPE